MIHVCGNCDRRQSFGDEMIGGCVIDTDIRTHDYDSCREWEPGESYRTAEGMIGRQCEEARTRMMIEEGA